MIFKLIYNFWSLTAKNIKRKNFLRYIVYKKTDISDLKNRNIETKLFFCDFSTIKGLKF